MNMDAFFDEDMIMESSDLIIRPTVFEACSEFARWENMEDVTEYLAVDEDVTYKQVVTEFILSLRDDQRQMFTITLKPSDKPIGRIVLSRITRRSDSLHLKRLYIADKNLRGKGYGEQAARTILEYSFINMHMERVSMDHLKGDEVTEMLCRKLGAVEEGIMRHSEKKDGKYIDLYRMSLLRAEYYDRNHDDR